MPSPFANGILNSFLIFVFIQVILVNEELVNHGLAEWIYPEEDNNNDVVAECVVERDEMEETAAGPVVALTV